MMKGFEPLKPDQGLASSEEDALRPSKTRITDVIEETHTNIEDEDE